MKTYSFNVYTRNVQIAQVEANTEQEAFNLVVNFDKSVKYGAEEYIGGSTEVEFYKVEAK
jgi:hypothetical protein